MTVRAQLLEQRDQALRDLADIDRQAAAGELSERSAQRLRARYEAQAAVAIARLDSTQGQAPRPRPQPGRRGGTAAYLLAGAAALAAIFLLPGALLDRPEGGFVSGNEVQEAAVPAKPAPRIGPPTGVAGPSATAAPVRDLSKIPDTEMEAVVDANPSVVGMRLALAGRYVEARKFDKALGHYRQALKVEPGNAQALAWMGWTLLQLGLPDEAAKLVAKARSADPSLDQALWFDANIRLYGAGDPAGAVRVLQEMRSRTLTPTVQRQVDELLGTARARAAGGS